MSTPGQLDVAVIVLTFNEEENIAATLDSVHDWAREIFVVDSYSFDKTVEIARRYPKVHVAYHAFRNYSDQWNWALDNLPMSAAWVMKLDADEIVTPGLRDELARELPKPGNPLAGYFLRRYLCFMRKRLRFGGYSKFWHLRVWRRGKGRFEQRPVNEHVLLDGPAGRLRGYLLHDDRKGLSAWLWRHNRYSSMEAEAAFHRHEDQVLRGPTGRVRWIKRWIWPWIPCKPTVFFLYRYVFQLGFLDGVAGYRMCRLGRMYMYLIELKKAERRTFGAVSSQEAISPMPKGLPPAATVTEPAKS